MSSLQQVSRPLMPAVKPNAVTGVEPLHAAAQIRLRRLHQQVKMIIHQNINVQPPLEKLHRLAQQVAEMPAVTIITINRTPFIAAGGDMMPRSRPLDSRNPSHLQTP